MAVADDQRKYEAELNRNRKRVNTYLWLESYLASYGDNWPAWLQKAYPAQHKQRGC